jgi:nucleotide-binding universal stress UspA family protein
MNVRHILLMSDFSEEAARAYGPVSGLARTLRARITLLHVVQVLARVPYGAMAYGAIPVTSTEEDLKAARAGIERQRDLLGVGGGGLEVAVDVVAADNVAKAIVDYASGHGADLIALSTHGRSGLRRVLLGSVSEEVLRRAHVPVLLFPPPAE